MSRISPGSPTRGNRLMLKQSEAAEPSRKQRPQKRRGRIAFLMGNQNLCQRKVEMSGFDGEVCEEGLV